jgi:zinc protease
MKMGSRAAGNIARRLIRSSVFGLALLALPSARLAAQESAQTPPGKVERKNRAPAAREMLRVKIPKPTAAKLKNGLTVLILEDHRSPSVTVQLHISGAGGLFEPPALAGLAGTAAQMLREGTQSRTSIQIAEEVDRLGATLGAGSSFGSPDAVLSASGLSDNFDAWFGLAVEILLNPSFPVDELEKLKQRQRAQLRQQRAAAGFLVAERFNRAVYGEHPAAIVSATPESIDAITREALVGWHRERYRPQHAILGIAGDVSARRLVPKLEKWLADWQKNPVKEVWPRAPVATAARQIFLVDRPGSVQATVALGNIAIDRRSPDYLAMTVMNHVIGGGAAGRLFLNLREEKGYTYGVYSNFTALRYPGPWQAGGNMRTEATAGALVEFFNEIRRIREEQVPAAELAASKRAIAARFALSLEQPAAILGLAIARKQYDLSADYWDNYPARIMAVSADEVQRVARKYLDPDAMQLVAVGDASKLKSVLEQYGAVEVYDEAGRPVRTGTQPN